MKRALLGLAGALVLAGCGAGQPKPLTGTAALEAKIRDLPRDTRRLEVSCVSRTCTLTWNERVHDVHESWLIARTTIAELDDSYYRPMRHFRLSIRDRRTQRLWSFACRADYRGADYRAVSDAHWPYDRCVQTVRPLT